MSGEVVGVILLVVLLSAVVLVWGIPWLREMMAFRHEPEVVHTCCVGTKRKTEEQGAGWDPTDHYFVTFLLDSGAPVELPVPEKDFGRLTEGARGALHTRGRWYRGFTAEA